MFEIIFALYGGALYRWRGHASKYKKYLPRPFNQILFALPYCWYAFDQTESLMLATLVLGATVAGTLTGHGNFFNNDTIGDKFERLEWLILPLWETVSLRWYKFAGMAVTGVAITISAGMAASNLLLVLSGVLKGVAYQVTKKTEIGEFLTGFLLYLVLSFFLW